MADLPGAPDPHPFLLELEDLARLEHPAFPTVLDVGATKGRSFYCVPAFSGPTVADLLGDPGTGLDTRAEVARAIAAGIAAAHARGVTLGNLRPEHLAWEAESERVVFLHLDRREEGTVLAEARRLAGEGEDPESLDVRLWGVLASRLLTRGAPLFEEDEAIPLGSRELPLLPAFVAVVDGALAGRGEARPRSGTELDGALRVSRANLLGEDEGLEAPRFDPGSSMELLSGTLATVRERAGKQAPRRRSRERPTFRTLEADESPATAPGWSTGAKVGAMVALFLLAVGGSAGVTLWLQGPRTLGGPAGPARPGPTRPGPTRPAPAPPPPAGEAAVPPPAAPPAPVLPAPSPELAHIEDPYLRQLASVYEVPEELFLPTWQLMRNLAVRRRLPAGVVDLGELLALRDLHAKDPAAARAELEERVDALRRELGAGR